MSHGWNFKSGDWNSICDSCGRKFKASDLKKRWDGLMVCSEDYEQRHQMDFLRTRADKITPPWIKPKLVEVFRNVLGEQDNLQLTEQIVIASTYIRNLSDNISLTEVVNPFRSYYINESLSLSESQLKAFGVFKDDTVSLLEFNYFAEDYMVDNNDYILPAFILTRGSSNSDSVNFNELISFIKGILRSDQVVFTDSGIINLPLYIDASYFAADYIATTQTF